MIALVTAMYILLLGPAADHPKPAPNPGFEMMKSLVGTWETTTPDGKSATSTYQIVSSGTALMESMDASDHMNMVTMYHPDGNRLMMTHYCASNNQPRMRTEAISGDMKKFTFTFVDVSNLASPDAGYMSGLAVTFEDADHFTQEWTSRENGKDTTWTFRWARKK